MPALFVPMTTSISSRSNDLTITPDNVVSHVELENFSSSLAGYITREYGFKYKTFPSAPVLSLDAFIARLTTHANAPRAAGFATLAVMDITDELPLPMSLTSPQTHFLAALRFVLVNIYHRSERASQWVEYSKNMVTAAEIACMEIEMEDAIAQVMTASDLDILLRIPNVDWDDEDTVARNLGDITPHKSHKSTTDTVYNSEDDEEGELVFSTAEEYDAGYPLSWRQYSSTPQDSLQS
ncbi:hypothetical protein HGRIS_014747 [Hohenbuehelia grisea]|uniref:Uncharacterized protein n=1 Tax=Hohenbuehelia grisea TaxID=104357 RepID=A0ABR3IQM7_9AGAR